MGAQQYIFRYIGPPLCSQNKLWFIQYVKYILSVLKINVRNVDLYIYTTIGKSGLICVLCNSPFKNIYITGKTIICSWEAQFIYCFLPLTRPSPFQRPSDATRPGLRPFSADPPCRSASSRNHCCSHRTSP